MLGNKSNSVLRIRVGVVGGGIGGLAAAVALSRLGHDVTVYEAASKISEIGAGIQITPNASKHLIEWGVDKYLPDLTSTSPCFKVRRWETGDIIGRMEIETFHQKFGGPYVQLHRADLQSGLLTVAKENGVQIHTNSRVADFDLDKPEIILADGQSIHVDLVVSADGIKSVGRHKLSGSEAPSTISTGLAVCRATVDMQLIKKHPNLLHLANEPGINLWIGPHVHAVAYAMRGDSLLNLILEYREDKPPSEWDESTVVEEVKAVYANWDPNLSLLLNQIKSGVKWPLRFSIPLDKWSSESGRFVLLGDAAHVVPSFLAQGAAMAIEDSAVLSRILSNASSLADLPTSLQDFEKQRMDRKAKVQSLSLRNLQLYHLEDGQDQRKRDGVDEFDNEEDRHQLSPIWRSVQDQHWLYGYDGGLQTVDK